MTTTPEPCVHYDIIGPHPLYPDQARDVGTCALCGRQRKYTLVMGDMGFADLRMQPTNSLASEEIAAYTAESMKEN